ncbi:unnamed protein product [Spirodela intermedia]|uniref:Uncharacterized protein n=1 Tax=Spirodela intermedia TaxID=51605 RepID=A0A7I8JH45_SPIIN|nr:unnamed protein product [Spirodela intermedia]CAA6669458.1 unnamed protein product [Spirodela intermedia]
MNPLTQVKQIQKITSLEASLGLSEEASWHAKYKGSAYVFVGGIPFDLTEGDLLAVFAQYGEVVDVNLVRDKGTGKSKGFAFIAYEDQRSTILAVGFCSAIIRVDHVSNYKKKEEEEDEEEAKRKREARGVCHAFQRGECNRGDSCKFSHDEQRNANTGWGAQDSSARWAMRSSRVPEESREGPGKAYSGRTEGEDARRTSGSSRAEVGERWASHSSRRAEEEHPVKSHPSRGDAERSRKDPGRQGRDGRPEKYESKTRSSREEEGRR